MSVLCWLICGRHVADVHLQDQRGEGGVVAKNHVLSLNPTQTTSSVQFRTSTPWFFRSSLFYSSRTSLRISPDQGFLVFVHELGRHLQVTLAMVVGTTCFVDVDLGCEQIIVRFFSSIFIVFFFPLDSVAYL